MRLGYHHLVPLRAPATLLMDLSNGTVNFISSDGTESGYQGWCPKLEPAFNTWAKDCILFNRPQPSCAFVPSLNTWPTTTCTRHPTIMLQHAHIKLQ